MSFRAQRISLLLSVSAISLAVVFAIPTTASAVSLSAFSVSPSTTAQGGKPSLTTRLVRAGSPSEGIRTATVKYPGGLQLTLPSTRCSSTQFNADNCPAGSLVGPAMVQGVAAYLISTSLPGHVYALTSGSIGMVLRPSGFSKLHLIQSLTSSGGRLTAATGLPERIKLFGLLELSFSASELKYEYKNPLVTNPTNCGPALSDLNLLAWNGATASGSSSYTITGCVPPDTSSPVVNITSPPAGTSSDNPVAVAYMATDNDATLDCEITNNGTVTTSPVTLDEGSNTIVVTCADDAGNSGSDSVVVDWTAPDTSDPNVEIVSPQDGTATANPTVGVSFSATDNDTSLECDISVNGSEQSSPVTLSPGINVIRVTCTDTAGNEGFDEVTITHEPPMLDTTISKFANPSAHSSDTESVEFDGDGTGFECRLDDGPWSSCVSPWNPPLIGLASPQLHSYDVRATDGAILDPTPARGHIWIDDRAWGASLGVAAQPNDLTPAANVLDAGRHPDLEVSLGIVGQDDADSLQIRFPDGLMTSLAAVPAAERCSLTQADTGACPLTARIGSVSAAATSARDGDIVAAGDLFLVDSGDVAIPSDAIASVALDLEAPNDIGRIRVIGHIKLPKTDGSRAVLLSLPDIPNATLASTTSETRPSALRLHARSLDLTVDGDKGGSTAPGSSLLTNPHYCGPTFTSASWASPNQRRFNLSGSGHGGSTTSNVTSAYEVTNCSASAFSPTITMQTVDQLGDPVNTAGEPFRLLADLELPPEAAVAPNATIGRTAILLPPQVSLRFQSLGSPSTHMCPLATSVKPSSSPAYEGYQWFDPISAFTGVNGCTSTASRAAASRVGTATITTPLTEAPLVGAVYFLSQSVFPRIGIWFDPSVAPTNPKGISLGFVVDWMAVPYAGSEEILSMAFKFDSLPDIPITRLQLDLGNNTSRPATLGAPILDWGAPTDPACLPRPSDDPETPFDDTTAEAGEASTLLRPWPWITSDQMMMWFGASHPDLLSTPSPDDVELRSPFPIDGCEMPE